MFCHYNKIPVLKKRMLFSSQLWKASNIVLVSVQPPVRAMWQKEQKRRGDTNKEQLGNRPMGCQVCFIRTRTQKYINLLIRLLEHP